MCWYILGLSGLNSNLNFVSQFTAVNPPLYVQVRRVGQSQQHQFDQTQVTTFHNNWFSYAMLLFLRDPI